MQVEGKLTVSERKGEERRGESKRIRRGEILYYMLCAQPAASTPTCYKSSRDVDHMTSWTSCVRTRLLCVINLGQMNIVGLN